MFRSNTDQLERSSIEGLVYDTDVGGHGDDDDKDLLPDPIIDQVAPSNPCPGDNLHSKDAISKKKCIVFSYKLIDILKALDLRVAGKGVGEIWSTRRNMLEHVWWYLGHVMLYILMVDGTSQPMCDGRWTSQPHLQRLG